jgi:hypothetical protein
MFDVFVLLAVTCKSTVHTERILRFHCEHGNANAPQCYVIHTLPFLFSFVSDTCHYNKGTEKAFMQVQIDCLHAPRSSPARAQHMEINQTFMKFRATIDGLDRLCGGPLPPGEACTEIIYILSET